MHEITVLIPYGNGTPWRRQALHTVIGWYVQNLENARILLGYGREPWCKARAVAGALERTREEPIVIVADADCIAPGIHEAVQAVRDGASWAMPHLKVHRLSRHATTKVHEGVDPALLTDRRLWLDQNPYLGYEGGGVTVLGRQAYLDCPLDPAFVGWGQEDESWAMALNGLYGPPLRSRAPLYHLWHEKPARLTRYAGSEASLARLADYKRVRINGGWAALLEDAREVAQAAARQGKVAI